MTLLMIEDSRDSVLPVSLLTKRSGSTIVRIRLSGSSPIETLSGFSNSILRTRAVLVKLMSWSLKPSSRFGAEVSSSPRTIFAVSRSDRSRSLVSSSSSWSCSLLLVSD